MRKPVAIAIVLSAAPFVAILLLRESPVSLPRDSARPVAAAPADSARNASGASPVEAAGSEKTRSLVRFDRPRHYDAFDFNSKLKRSLREAERDSAEAQYRASVMLTYCPGLRASAATNAELAAKGLADDQIALIKDRARRCSGVVDLIPDDPTAASRRLWKAALEKDFPIAVADREIVARDPPSPAVLSADLIDGQAIPSTPLPADEIDARLRAALETAGNDRVLRYEAFLLVVGAMEGRSAANGMEADPVVRNAWTLLHCRESWECDLDATIDYLLLEMPVSTLSLAAELAREIDTALDNQDLSGIRLH